MYYAILETTGKVRKLNCDPRNIEEERGDGTIIAQGETEEACDRILKKDPNGKLYWC